MKKVLVGLILIIPTLIASRVVAETQRCENSEIDFFLLDIGNNMYDLCKTVSNQDVLSDQLQDLRDKTLVLFKDSIRKLRTDLAIGNSRVGFGIKIARSGRAPFDMPIQFWGGEGDGSNIIEIHYPSTWDFKINGFFKNIFVHELSHSLTMNSHASKNLRLMTRDPSFREFIADYLTRRAGYSMFERPVDNQPECMMNGFRQWKLLNTYKPPYFAFDALYLVYSQDKCCVELTSKDMHTDYSRLVCNHLRTGLSEQVVKGRELYSSSSQGTLSKEAVDPHQIGIPLIKFLEEFENGHPERRNIFLNSFRTLDSSHKPLSPLIGTIMQEMQREMDNQSLLEFKNLYIKYNIPFLEKFMQQ